jgi:formate dehydrogenase subunit beta
MAKSILIKGDPEEAARNLAEFLLTSGKVGGVVTLVNAEPEGAVNYSLVTDAEVLKNASPLYPLMPTNAGGVLSHLTAVEGFGTPVAVFVRPCELRAYVELGKLGQIKAENILLISTTCGGVYPLDDGINGNLKEKLPTYWAGVSKGENAEGLRVTCGACEHFVPYQADLTIGAVGAAKDKRCAVFLNTPRGEEAVDGLEADAGENELENDALGKLRKTRVDTRAKLFEEGPVPDNGLEGLVAFFGRCIGCHSCRTVCPICYCDLCHFESTTREPNPISYEIKLKHRAGTRVPPDTILFQLGRLTHMSVSCVGCGMCSDACPAEIPIATLFAKVGAATQGVFDYVPGKNAEETPPLSRFEEEEFTEFGEEVASVGRRV